MIEARVNLSLVNRALNTLRKPDLRPAFKLARKPLRDDIRDHRRKRQSPGGSWAPRAASTRVRAAGAKRSRPLLGKLPTALATKVSRQSLRSISRVPWSDVHRTGGTVGHGAKLPGRDFLWASGQALGAIAGLVSAHLAKLFRGER